MHQLVIKKTFFLITFISFLSIFFGFDVFSRSIATTVDTPMAPMKNPIVLSQTIEDILVAQQPISINKTKVAPRISLAAATIGKPVRLSIPKIGVNTLIEHIGLTPEGAVGVPEGAVNVSWFSVGVRPGQMGSALISGHSGIWKDGTHSVFDLLPTLTPGDKIYVKDDYGALRSFVVRDMRVYQKDQKVPEIFNRYDKPYLNIITCHGTWLPSQHTYDKRLVVFAELEN